MNKYKIYCETDSKWEEVIASVEPTQCPVDNVHTVKADSVSVIENDILVRDGTALSITLAELKQLRYNEIDGKTAALIAPGFTYDGKQFSLSVTAQMNWNGLKTNEADFSWPVAISTIDNYEYSLAQANLSAFWTAGRDVVKAALDGGRDLKKQIYDAIDEAAVNAIVDNR